jgi:hypothetical protein
MVCVMMTIKIIIRKKTSQGSYRGGALAGGLGAVEPRLRDDVGHRSWLGGRIGHLADEHLHAVIVRQRLVREARFALGRFLPTRTASERLREEGRQQGTIFHM